MKQWTPAPGSPAIPSINFADLVDRITRAIDTALNRIFGLRHQASITRRRVVVVGFLLAWMASIMIAIPELIVGSQEGGFLQALHTTIFVEPINQQEWVLALLKAVFVVVFHPAVLKHMLAFIVPFWVMYHFTAIYLADIFEEQDITARQLVMKAAFGRGYETIRIHDGKVAEEHQGSTIIKIGGPGYVQVDLDSAALFERPDGTPHVIGPTDKEIIDGFERIRRVIDLRDSIETIELPLTRSRDGVIVGAKDIQFSYSIHRGEAPNRAEKPYPFSPGAVESLVYKDTRVVKPGLAPSRKPEWESGPFKMGGPIMAEMGGFISKRGLSEFLAAIGEPEENLLTAREQKIDQFSQSLSGINGDLASGPLLQAPDFASRTSLTDIFYNQADFQKRMADKGFTLNWIGVGTWYPPAEIISTNHREAWKASRENYVRGNAQALESLQAEAKLQELLRLVQTLSISKFYNEMEKMDDERMLDSLLQAYEEILRQAADLYVRGRNGLDLRLSRLAQDGVRLFERYNRPYTLQYDDLLQTLVTWPVPPPSIFTDEAREWLSRAAEIGKDLQTVLESEDREFLQQAARLYQDLKRYDRIESVIKTIGQVRRPHHSVGR